MKKVIFGIVLSLILGNTNINAYAKMNLDEFGNEIDWDTEGIGNEEGAGDEGDYIPINADLLDMERLKQEESESESIAEIINQKKIDESEIENGMITLKFLYPEKWRGSNIKVSLYNKDLWKSFDVYIYKQNGFEEQEELPCGEYELRGASVVGDVNKVYPLLIEANGEESFKLEQGGEKIVINVELAETKKYIKESKAEENQGESFDKTEENAEKKETVLEKTTKEFLYDNLIFIMFLMIGFVGFALYKKKSEMDAEEDEE